MCGHPEEDSEEYEENGWETGETTILGEKFSYIDIYHSYVDTIFEDLIAYNIFFMVIPLRNNGPNKGKDNNIEMFRIAVRPENEDFVFDFCNIK